MNKLFKNILYLSSLTLALASCQSEEKVAPGEQDVDGCFGVYFPAQEDAVDLTLDPADPTSATITVMRKNAVGEITVPVTVQDTSGLFVWDPITFEDGQTETTFDLTFDNIGIGNAYQVSFTISDPLYASKYGANPVSLDFKVIREKWNELGTVDFSEDYYWGIEIPADDPDAAVLYRNDLDTTLYRLENPFAKKYSGSFAKKQDWLVFKLLKPGDVLYPGQGKYETKITENGLVYFEDFNSGYVNSAYNEDIWIMHPSGFSSAAGDETKWDNNKVLQYQPNGLPAAVQLAPFYYLKNEGGGWNASSEENAIVIVFPGAVLTDYSVEIASGESADGEIPVEFTLGKDVAEAKYAVYEGELSKAAGERHANAIAKGTEESQTVPESGAVSLKFDKSGVYSVVAVTFDDKGAFQSSDVATLNYVAKGDEGNYAVNVSAGLELTSRYEPEGYTKLNSAQFYVYGKDLTDLKAVVYQTEKLDMEKIDSIARAPKSVSDSLLNLANTTGWSDLATGLSPLTDYTLVVWASNGYSSKIVTAEVTTEGLPRVKKGTGDYTYGVLFEGTDKELELYSDPNYKNTYVIPDWCYGVDFTFTYDPATGKVSVPLQYIGYTHSSYGPVYVVEAKNYFEPGDEGYDTLVDSKYDAETGTFEFCVAYVVQGGTFGSGVETFKVDGDVSFTSAGKASARPYSVKLNNIGGKLNGSHVAVKKTAQGMNFAGIRAERDAASVKFSVRAIQKGSVSHEMKFTKTSARITR